MDLLDLQRHLQNESGNSEWKRRVADPEDVAQTLCAFANDIDQRGGGAVICGVEEVAQPDGSIRANPIGLEPGRVKELWSQVPALCRDRIFPPLIPRVSLIPVQGDKKIVAFEISSSPHAHSYKNRQNEVHYWIRVRDRTERANGRLEELLRLKRVFPHLMSDVNPDAGIGDLDTFALREFLETLDLPQPVERYLEPDVRLWPEVPSLIAGKDGSLRPRNFALLLFGKQPSRFLPGAFATITIYAGTSRAGVKADDATIRGPIPRLLRDCLSRLQGFLGSDIDKSETAASGRQNRPRFSRRAIEEALANAVVHRDYLSAEPVQIHVFDDRIEFASPGGLPPSMSVSHFENGEAMPDWRNPELALFLFSLGLTQRRGQGVSTIIQETNRLAGQRPAMRVDAGHVTVVIPAGRPLQRQPASGHATPHDGLILVSIGGASIKDQVDASLPDLGLGGANVAVDFHESGYVSERNWIPTAERLRDQIGAVVDSPNFLQFHLFYRGPVAFAALVGAMFAGAKKLSVYNYEEGRYAFAYSIDRRFLKG